MDNKIIFEDDKIILKRNNNQFIFEIDYIENLLNDFFKKNFIPKTKSNEILFLFENDDKKILRIKNYNIRFLKENSNTKDVLQIYNSINFRIICGFEEDFVVLSPLEQFFTHGNDMIIIFNSDNRTFIEETRGIFNAETFTMDFFNEKQIHFTCKEFNTHLIKNIEYHKYNDFENLYEYNSKFFILSSKKCKCKNSNLLIDTLFYNLDNLLILKTKSNTRFALSQYIFSKDIVNLHKYILKSEYNIFDKEFVFNVLIYNKNYNNDIKKLIKNYISNLIEENNLMDYNISINIRVFQ